MLGVTVCTRLYFVILCTMFTNVQCALVRNAWLLLFAVDRRRFRAEGHQLGRQHADPTAAVGHRRCVACYDMYIYTVVTPAHYFDV